MLSIELVTDYCKNIRKDIGTLSKVLDCAENLRNSKNPKDRLAKRSLKDYDSIKKIAYSHGPVSPLAKKMENYISKFHSEDMKSLEGIQKTAQKLSDIKEIYKYENIKGTGLSELRKICNNNNFFKDVKFKCSEKAQEISQKVTEFFELVQETNKKIKKFSHSSAKNPIRNETLIVNKYYMSVKSEKEKSIKNFSDIEKDCQKLKDKILSEVGKLSEKNKNLAEIAKHTPSGATKQDEQDYEEKIEKFSEDFMQAITALKNSKIDESTFNYLKKFRTLEKEILADKNNGVGISLPDVKKRMLTLDKRWKLFNKAVIEGNYNNGDKSALKIIEKNLRKIEQINISLKSNSENEVDIEKIEDKVDDYISQEANKTLDVEEFVGSITIDNLEEKTKSLGQFGDAQESIEKLKRKIETLGTEHGSTYGALFGLFVIRNTYIEILGFLVKANEFLVKIKSLLNSLEGNGDKKEEGWLKGILNSKAVNMFTKFSAIGCFTGVMLSIGCPYLAPIVAGLAVTAIVIQIAQVATSTSGA